MIKQIVIICEVVDEFLWKPFRFFHSVFSADTTENQLYLRGF